jgi:hypothetical protein
LLCKSLGAVGGRRENGGGGVGMARSENKL